MREVTMSYGAMTLSRRVKTLILSVLLALSVVNNGVTAATVTATPSYSVKRNQNINHNIQNNVGDLIVAGGLDGRVYAISAWTGEVLWTFDSGGPMVDSTTCFNAPHHPSQPPQHHHYSQEPSHQTTPTVDVTQSHERSVIHQQQQANVAAFMAQLVPAYDGRLYHLSKSKVRELEMTMADIVNANGPVRLVDQHEHADGETSVSDVLLFGEKRTEIFTLDAKNGLLQPYYPTGTSSPSSSSLAPSWSSGILFGRSEYKTRAVHAQNASSARCFTISEYFLQFAEQSRCSIRDEEAVAAPPEILVVPKDPTDVKASEDEGSTIVTYDPLTEQQLWELEIPHFDVLAVYGISTTRGSTFFRWKVDGPSSSAAQKLKKTEQLIAGRDESTLSLLPSSLASVDIKNPLPRGEKLVREQPVDEEGDKQSKQLSRVLPRKWNDVESRFRLRLLGDNYFLETSQHDFKLSDRSRSSTPISSYHDDEEEHPIDEAMLLQETMKRRNRRIFWESIVNDGKPGVFISYYHVGAMAVGISVGCILIAWGCYVKGLSASFAQQAIKSIDNNQFFISHMHQLTIERPGEENITISSVISRALLMDTMGVQRPLPLLGNGESSEALATIPFDTEVDTETEAMMLEKFTRLAAIKAASAITGTNYSSYDSKLLQLEYVADSKSSSSSSSLVVNSSAKLSFFDKTKELLTSSSSSSFDVVEVEYEGHEERCEFKTDSTIETAEMEFLASTTNCELEEKRGETNDVVDVELIGNEAKSALSSRSSDTTGNCCSTSDSEDSKGLNISDTSSKSSSSVLSSVGEGDTRNNGNNGDESSIRRKTSDASSSDSSGPNEAEVLFPFVCQSRFVNEFEEISAIGKGGFGQVMLAENRLDGRKYAIKRVGLYLKNQTSKTLQKFLREVKILALLDHPNIVRYYQAWLEKVEENDKKPAESATSSVGIAARNYSMSNMLAPISEMEFSVSKQFRSGYYSNGSILDDEDDGGFEWERDSSAEVNDMQVWKEEDLVVHSRRQTRRNKQSNDELPSTRPLKDEGSDEDSSCYSIDKCDHWLYIQMQYCAGRNLGDFLALPNRPMELSRLLKIFVQIASALAHVHSCGLIHRDLKPANIFVADTDGDSIKLGDFGLSRYAANVNLNGPSSMEEHHQQLTSVTGSTTSIMNGGQVLSSSLWSVSISNMSESNEVTAGVGTYLYASPEQVAGKKYNAKTDIYSLGMILFELCHERFTTTMERYMTLRNAREGNFPDTYIWKRKCPELMEMLSKLLSQDPLARPSAEEVVQWGQELYEASLVQQAMDVIRSPVHNSKLYGTTPLTSIDHLMGSGSFRLHNKSSTLSLQVEAKMERSNGENGQSGGERRSPNHNLLKEVCDVITQVSDDKVEIKKFGLHLQDEGVQVLEFVLDPYTSTTDAVVDEGIPSEAEVIINSIIVSIQALPGVQLVRRLGQTE